MKTKLESKLIILKDDDDVLSPLQKINKESKDHKNGSVGVWVWVCRWVLHPLCVKELLLIDTYLISFIHYDNILLSSLNHAL